jgi:hypothetical protein
MSAYMLGRVSEWTSRRGRQFHGEFTPKKRIFSGKPWFKRLAGESTTGFIDWIQQYSPICGLY